MASSHVENVPFVGSLMKCSEGLFCPRGGTPEAREETVRLIGDRQREVDEGKS